MRPNWFIALPVAAGPWLAALVPPPAVRVFGASDLHLTVAFLGAVSPTAARAAFALADAFPLHALDVQLGPVVALGAQARPSAFSATLSKGREPVERAIAQARSAMLEAAFAPVDTRTALAHLTLARPQRRATDAQRERAVQWARALDLGAPTVRIDRIALYTWSDDRAHALFRIDQQHALPER